MNPRHTTPDTAPRRSGLRGLIIVNIVLLIALSFITFAAPGIAQYRAPGAYRGVGAIAGGFDSGILVIVDETNQAMIGLSFDPNTGKFTPAGRRDLAADSATLRSR